MIEVGKMKGASAELRKFDEELDLLERDIESIYAVTKK